MAASLLSDYRVLLADADREISKVTTDMMVKMGFRNITYTKSGKEAFTLIQNKPFDFLITEWNTKDVDGINLLDRIRRDPESPVPTLPIIMLTGRAEEADVVAARDHGINEYVVKPFTAKTLYSRLERIIEHPRNFIITKSFLGPDRRHKGKPPEGMPERRTARITPEQQPKNVSAKAVIPSVTPKIWLPDYSLKLKLGEKQSLASLITPEVLGQAQAAVDAISKESLDWIKADLMQLKSLHQSMIDGNYLSNVAQEMGAAALSINSRAGTFGFMRASQVAYMLYLFCRNKLNPQNTNHHIVVEKHIDVLQVILGSQAHGDEGELGVQIITELTNLAHKYGA